MSSVIQWFPGHMNKAKREVSEKLKFVDIVFELVDARLPISSRNPLLDQILQQKPRLIILNKTDLADPKQTKLWQGWFQEQGFLTVGINSHENSATKLVVNAAKEVLKEKRARDRARGLKPRSIRAMVVGIPNVGKSTLMNRLVGKKIAQTGNKPGVTKGQQWLKSGSELELLDTPGILWPRFEDPAVGKKLALTGAIKDQLLHLDDIAIYGLGFFCKYYPGKVVQRYKLAETDESLPPVELLMEITAKRGYKDDYDRGSELVVVEIRQNKLGPFTLDRYGEGASLPMSESIKDIKAKLAAVTDVKDAYLLALAEDSRAGVQKLLQQTQKRIAKEAALVAKYHEMMHFEQPLLDQGHRFIAGIDEVGRGPLAGPVVACAVILSPDHPIYGLDDSKKLSAKRRGKLFSQIQENALGIGIGVVEPADIDRLNIYQASRLAMKMAVEELPIPPSYLLLDAMKIVSDLPQEKIIKGDAKSVSIAAASIVAKEMRDSLMREYHKQYPHYGFDQNAGYGTKVHLQGLQEHGVTAIHRKTFTPVAALLN